ncbi:PDZ domain (Also known as DHR or GLGF), partial [Gilliamella apicola SCGC AB-598-B02]
SRQSGLSSSTLSNALARPWTKGEFIIAQALDGSKAIFIQSDVDTFRNRQELLGQELFDGNLKTAYDIYNLAMHKRYERYKYALKVLQSPMDFSTDDEIDFNREDISWPTTEKELDSYWDKRVKYDELSLSLSGKDENQIRETLTKRYNRVLKTIEQSNNEDAFQVFMNAFAREIDPHTSYLAPRKKRDFDTEMSLSFEGIGATLSQQDDYTVIMSFVTGGPAEKSKSIAVGDKIIGVGQSNSPIEDVIGWRLDDIVDKIRGPKGTVVKLEILPANNRGIHSDWIGDGLLKPRSFNALRISSDKPRSIKEISFVM